MRNGRASIKNLHLMSDEYKEKLRIIKMWKPTGIDPDMSLDAIDRIYGLLRWRAKRMVEAIHDLKTTGHWNPPV